MSLRVDIACPARAGTHNGNRITALRWQAILRQLGHQPKIHASDSWGPRSTHSFGELLVALHARKSSEAIFHSKNDQPDRPVVLALTGTDLYRDGKQRLTQRSLELADQLIVLQSLAIKSLPKRHRHKARVIHQSIRPVRTPRPAKPHQLRVLVAGHLRSVKDPMRTEMAVRGLPGSSRILVRHFGATIEPKYEVVTHRANKQNARYEFSGQISHGELRQRLAKCWLLVLSSKLEGGANVLSEAIVQQTPVLASRIDGSVGLLGDSYEGYFDVGSTRQLRELLNRCEQEPEFYGRLMSQVSARSELFCPELELAAWRDLLGDLA